jgi:hypothetical protein
MTRVRYIPDQSQLSHALGFDHEVLWVLAVIKLQRNKPAPFGALHRLNLVGENRPRRRHPEMGDAVQADVPVLMHVTAQHEPEPVSAEADETLPGRLRREPVNR